MTGFDVEYCIEVIERLNTEEKWQLSQPEVHAYIAALIPRVQPTDSLLMLESVVRYYHNDHLFVERLLDWDNDAWNELRHRIFAVLSTKYLFFSSDLLIDLDDMTQLVLEAIVHALPSYNYRSRFSTWFYSVAIHTIKRNVRSMSAMKRSANPLSLDAEVIEDEILQKSDFKFEVEELEFFVLVLRVLKTHPDKRLWVVFNLWVKYDMKTQDIASVIGISPSRVRVLLSQARLFLREHPEMQRWIASEQEADSSSVSPQEKAAT